VPYPFPGIETLIADAQADITGSDLPNADGFLPRAILPLMALIQAGFALGHYDAIAYAMQQATPFTATDEWLDTWAALKLVFRKDATAAGVSGTSYVQILNCTPDTDLPAGTQVNRADGFSYTTLADATVVSNGIVSAPILATATGALGNAASGVSLTLNTSIAGITSAGTASTPITGGADQEDDDDLRTRMLFAYANPPAGGSETDYITWALAVAGVTRAWCLPNGAGAGTVVLYTMLDNANAEWGGFPQGSNGVATLELRDSAAQGDQLTVANAIYLLRPVTALVYSYAPVEEDIAYAIGELSPNTPAIQAAIVTALQGMHLRKAAVGGTTDTNGTLYPSDWNEAVAAVPGIIHFAITSPTTAVTPATGSLLTVGTPTFSST
jgi:uncharacterized phage protein gp47/JayE